MHVCYSFTQKALNGFRRNFLNRQFITKINTQESFYPNYVFLWHYFRFEAGNGQCDIEFQSHNYYNFTTRAFKLCVVGVSQTFNVHVQYFYSTAQTQKRSLKLSTYYWVEPATRCIQLDKPGDFYQSDGFTINENSEIIEIISLR